jgi:hypothetical protein
MTVTIRTKWPGLYGEKVKAPSGTLYQCSATGLMEVAEADAVEFCSTSGFQIVPTSAQKVPQKPAPQKVLQKQEVKPTGQPQRVAMPVSPPVLPPAADAED